MLFSFSYDSKCIMQQPVFYFIIGFFYAGILNDNSQIVYAAEVI